MINQFYQFTRVCFYCYFIESVAMIGQVASIMRDFFVALGMMKGTAFRYVFYTGLIALVLLILMIFGIWNFTPLIGSQIALWMPWEWAKQTVFFTVLTGIGVAWIFWVAMKYLLLILAGPMLSVVSEKLEKKLGNHTGIVGFSFVATTARTVRINMRNMLKELVLTVLLFAGGLIPGLNLIVLILLLIIQSYFIGFGIMDYYLERHYTYKESLAVVYRNKWAAITLGAIFTLLFLIPIIGVLVAPYLCTVAATRYFVMKEKVQVQ